MTLFSSFFRPVARGHHRYTRSMGGTQLKKGYWDVWPSRPPFHASLAPRHKTPSWGTSLFTRPSGSFKENVTFLLQSPEQPFQFRKDVNFQLQKLKFDRDFRQISWKFCKISVLKPLVSMHTAHTFARHFIRGPAHLGPQAEIRTAHYLPEKTRSSKKLASRDRAPGPEHGVFKISWRGYDIIILKVEQDLLKNWPQQGMGCSKLLAEGGIPGGYSTLVWVGVCRWDFWNATHPCTHFEGKVTHPCTKNQNFSLKFAPFWRKFRKILKSWPIKVPNLRHFGANFRKFWKIDPSKYHVFEKKGPIDVYLAPDFATHVCGTPL